MIVCGDSKKPLNSTKNADYKLTKKGNGKEGNKRVRNRDSNDYKLSEKGDN